LPHPIQRDNAHRKRKIRFQGFGPSCHTAACETTQAIEIAEAHNIPKKFLDAILRDYMLARAPSNIKIGQPCRDCKSVKTCTVRLMMMKVRDALSDVLDRLTLADMVAMGDGNNVALM
jgi:DNA-binding IscR family transcriptional regulator